MDKERLLNRLKLELEGEPSDDAEAGYDAGILCAISTIEQSLSGYMIVPEEPTEGMIEGFWGEITHGEPEIVAAKEAYKAMLKAAKG